MKFAVITFPGSNCDQDAYHAANHGSPAASGSMYVTVSA